MPEEETMRERVGRNSPPASTTTPSNLSVGRLLQSVTSSALLLCEVGETIGWEEELPVIRLVGCSETDDRR